MYAAQCRPMRLFSSYCISKYVRWAGLNRTLLPAFLASLAYSGWFQSWATEPSVRPASTVSSQPIIVLPFAWMISCARWMNLM